MLAAALLFLLALASLAPPAALAQVEAAPSVEETTKTSVKPAIADPNEAQRIDRPTAWLLGVVLTLLAIAFIVGRVLRRQPENFLNPALVRTFNKRIQAYWMMCAILAAALVFGSAATVLLFGLVSFWALREFVTMTPTRRSDHRALFWTFFVLTPLQYLLVGLSSYKYFDIPDLYSVYSILIPLYASLFIPARVAFAGDHKRFLERIAKIQAGLMICVYSLSFAPAILYLRIRPAWADENWDGAWGYGDNPGSMAGLLFYFVLMAQLGDVLSYAWGKLLGRHVIAPTINASRTWEGLIGGTLSTTLIGAMLWWVTPFQPWDSAWLAGVIALMGFAGSMTMSAIKRDRGVRDYGTLVTGHAGVLDRIDSICFAAPVFFQLTRIIFGA